MKISGAATEPFSANRRRALTHAGAQASATAASADTAAFLGLGQADLTPAVHAAVQTLLSEIDDLRGEVSRLKARLSQAETLADRDALTPLLNRRAFVRELGRIRAFSQRYGSPASLVFFDLDNFKSINDRFGHAVGDSALQTVAGRLTTQVRESDIVGRIGGDEFAVILVQADLAAAEAKAASLARALEDAPLELGDWSAPLHLTFGVSEISPDLEPEAILAQADAVMLARKRAKAAR